jgi:NADP-reducing hydrogenase subunit HndB
MSVIKSLEDLQRVREEALERKRMKTSAGKALISVAMGTCGIAVGARETMKAILNEIEVENLKGIVVTQTGCIGLCEKEPIVQVQIGNQPKVIYGKVSPSVAKQIVKEHLASGKVVKTHKIEA